MSSVKHRLMRNPYRRESSKPDMEVVLEDEAYFPGDTLVGLVRLDLEYAFDLITLELEVAATEKAVVGGFLFTNANPEVRRTTYYQQFVTLVGVSHDQLVQNSALKRSSLLYRPAAYLPTRKDAPPAQLRPVSDTDEDTSNGGGDGAADNASRRSSMSLYSPSTFGDVTGLEVMQLVPGSYTYPFAVPLPATLPPSNHIAQGREAETTLTYTVTARLIHKNGKSQFKAIKPFEVVALSVQLQRWLQLHRRHGNGMSAEEGETMTSISRQTSGSGAAMNNPNATDGSVHGGGGGGGGGGGATNAMFAAAERRSSEDDDEDKAPLRRLMDHTLQFTPEELAEEEERLQKEERRRRKEKKRKQKAAKTTALTVENVEGIDEEGGVVAEVVAQPDDATADSAANEADGEEDDEDAMRAEKAKEMEALLQLQQWEETFSIPLRTSVLKKTLIGLHVVLNTVVLARGYSRLCVTCMVDNTQGSSSISRLKYTLISRTRIMSKKEFFKCENKVVEFNVPHKVEKNKVARIDSVDLVVPPDMPVTMVTDGAETRTFLSIRLYVNSPLKTYSRSVEIEVLVTNGVDTRNKSRRLRTWSCYFKGTGISGKDTVPRPCIDLSAQNKEALLLDGAEALLPSVAAGTRPKAGEARVRFETNNFEQATFTPLDGLKTVLGDAAGHMDPMSGMNPFAEAEEQQVLEQEDETTAQPRRSFDVHEEVPFRRYPDETYTD